MTLPHQRCTPVPMAHCKGDKNRASVCTQPGLQVGLLYVISQVQIRVDTSKEEVEWPPILFLWTSLVKQVIRRHLEELLSNETQYASKHMAARFKRVLISKGRRIQSPLTDQFRD